MAQDNRVEDLIQRVAREYDDLSKQLKLIAQYITEHRQQMVVVRIRDVADACGVQPSAVVRFAQHFGFSGYSDLQAVFRDAYASGTTAGNYHQRLQAVISDHPAQMQSSELARGFLYPAAAIVCVLVLILAEPDYGTTVLTAADGSIAGLLGASPGASTAVPAMLEVMERCFGERYATIWQPKLKEMIPSLGTQLSQHPALFDEVWDWGTKVLGLESSSAADDLAPVTSQ